MDTEYIPSNNIKITYQNGLNGAKRSIIIPQWSIFTLGILLVFLFVSTFIFYAMLGNYAKLGDKVEQYKAENNSLRSKVDFYSAAVDSIYKMLEAPALKGSSTDADYPSLGLGNARQYSDFSDDPALKNQIDQLELKLAAILAQVNVSEPNPINHLPETPNAIYPADSMPSIYPSFGRISDGWGMRIHPISHTIEFHQGIDIANQAGTPIYATAHGTVTKIDYDSGYGKRIVISHDNGYVTLYAHLYSQMIRVGDSVKKGQIIGLMGSTGISTGPHLHYEVHSPAGKVNPSAYLNRIDEPAYALR